MHTPVVQKELPKIHNLENKLQWVYTTLLALSAGMWPGGTTT